MKQKEELALKQLELMTENNRKAYQRIQELETENRQLFEQMNKLSEFNDESITLVHALRVQVRRLEQEKEDLQNEVQITKSEVCTLVGSFLDGSCMFIYLYYFICMVLGFTYR